MLLAVLFGVALASLSRMLSSVVRMGRSTIGVIGSLFVIAGLVVLGGFGVVFSSLRVVDGGVPVAFCCFLRHGVEI